MTRRIIKGKTLPALVLASWLLGGGAACGGDLTGGMEVEEANLRLLPLWGFLGQKVVRAAEGFPEEEYDYRPTPEVRSFSEQLRHLAAAQNRYINQYAGEQILPEQVSVGTHPTKAEVVELLQESFGRGTELLEQTTGTEFVASYDLWVEAIEHSAEHLGQVVSYYRISGRVPPWSRQESQAQPPS